MQNFNTIFNVNQFERLFLDKSVECLYSNSIDSYRLRLHNPKTLIEELITVINDSINGVLTNNDYVDATTKELKRVLKTQAHGLIFSTINKIQYLNIIDKVNKKDYKIIQQSSKIILKDNLEYFENLIEEISILLNTYHTYIDRKTNKVLATKENDYHETSKKILYLIDFLYVELINKGFSKQYLYRIVHSIFIHYNKIDTNFDIQFNVFTRLLRKENENYSVIFCIEDSTFDFNEFKKINSSYYIIDKKFRNINKKLISTKGNEFLERNKFKTLIGINVTTKDHFKAVQLSIDQFSKDLDIFHLAFNNKSYQIQSHCLTIGNIDPSKANTVPVNYQIDGYFKSNTHIFNYIINKIKAIGITNIDKDSYQKILSAIRYYRTGTESPEMETKFLNYWIGLEFIFNSYSSEEKTIDRIRNYYSKSHSLIYIKRNLYDFHKTIKRFGIDILIPDYNKNLLYLLKNSTYQIVINNTECELLKHRSLYFQKWFQEPNKITDAINKHQENIIWNLTRLYRIRNEIVHNAAIKNEIYIHISHLKYYLTFILNSALDYMSDPYPDLDNDGKITIDDFLISQEIILGCLKGAKLENWIKIKHPNQIFQ